MLMNPGVTAIPAAVADEGNRVRIDGNVSRERSTSGSVYDHSVADDDIVVGGGAG